MWLALVCAYMGGAASARRSRDDQQLSPAPPPPSESRGSQCASYKHAWWFFFLCLDSYVGTPQNNVLLDTQKDKQICLDPGGVSQKKKKGSPLWGVSDEFKLKMYIWQRPKAILIQPKKMGGRGSRPARVKLGEGFIHPHSNEIAWCLDFQSILPLCICTLQHFHLAYIPWNIIMDIS
jgi:hypothetical protein